MLQYCLAYSMQNKNSRCCLSRISFAYFCLFVTMVQQMSRIPTPVHGWCPQSMLRFAKSGTSRTSHPGASALSDTRSCNTAWMQGKHGPFASKKCFSAYPFSSRLPFCSTSDDCIHDSAFYRHQQSRPLRLPLNSRFCFRFFSKNEIDADKLDDEDDFEVDETKSRRHSEWIVPTKIFIPEDQLSIKFVRSSGAGGQNVNKVSSCVQVRFHVLSAEWMGPYEVRDRFTQAYKNQISKDGIFQIESQAHRTQPQNRKDVMEKIEQAVLAVWPRPKLRRVRFGLSVKGEKTKQSLKKESRRNSRYDF
jgi:ribosome-associated protein